MSTLVWQCQRLLNDISIHHSVGLFRVSGHYEICGNETVHELTREGSVHQSVTTELALGISGQNIKEKSSVGLLTSTCHHGRVLPALRDRFENWSWALVLLLIIGYCPLLGHNPGYLVAFLLVIPWEGLSYIMELINSPLCRKWGAE